MATIEEEEEPIEGEKNEDNFTIEPVGGEEPSPEPGPAPGPKGDENENNNDDSDNDEDKMCFCETTWHKCSICLKNACQWCTITDSDSENEMKRHHPDCKEPRKKPEDSQVEEESDVDDPQLPRKKPNQRILSSSSDEDDTPSKKTEKDSAEKMTDPMKNVPSDKLGTDKLGRKLGLGLTESIIFFLFK